MTAQIAFDPSVELVDTRFTVPGMRCAGCIAKIESGLVELPGVISARVNFSTKRVAVRHDHDIAEDGLLAALQQLGFEAAVADANPLATDERETKRLLRALAVAGFGMMNIMLLSVAVWSGAGGVTRDVFHWLSALIAIPVVAYAGQPFFASALMALRYRRTNMDVPISIGVLLATALSLYETATGGAHAYFDGAVMLLFFLLCGRALDAMMRNRTRAGIGALLGRMGKSASVIQSDWSLKRIAADKLEVGMLMSVAAGEALAADGVVEDGSGAIDNGMLTGESTPVPISTGGVVFAGALNLLGPLTVRITAVASDTAIAEIARLMDEAGQSRSRYVRVADRAARLYAPAVHTLAVLSFVGWMVAGAGVHQSLVIAIAVLIITCPCAMGLAVPAAQVVASNTLVRHGLLVKDGSALERLAEVDMALFDKTGTLTLGEPRPDVSGLGETERAVALALAQKSRHPLSRGLAATLTAQGVKPAVIDSIDESAGFGISGRWNDTPVAIGRASADGAALASELTIGDQSWTVRFSDPMRPDAVEALADLQSMHIASVILSGDKEEAVQDVANMLGIDALSAMEPANKLAQLNRLKANGHRPLMVGDGLNDGPALAAAHASIAPATASDASQQAADAVFIGERLAPVALAVRIARSTMAIVRQNFVIAIGYNILAVPLAIAGLVTPIIAAIAMSCSSLIVVANSLRLARAAK
ncbi:E1-E2 type cation ATPase [Aurantiacibacter atlanticus]|uniref:E1-E2 type cation ATPase n=1 Tax=Aurantiacibacter atlanticus TaxID=1648404 RepID=A0A0H4W015_9SPHN|nr:heavy metal translocating P-type ATPase [Aurantiacibacter atlanticus]AKQ42793.1 E1-E2 type cation ATPase [Aurantiacibacter atlanticus]MDF1835021.1 heavy metal translocating P-type ATPase [Alteraurantiacibacter sp. bin_em_oilr2.035]